MGAGAPIKAGIKFVKSGLDDLFDYAGEAIDALGNKIGALPDANAVLTKPKPTATELRRQANIDRFGYDPNDVPDAPARTPTDDAGFESYLEQVNPNFKRIAAKDRPNLMMGDMYGMLPRNSEVIRSENGVTFYRAPNGDHYATAFNPDVNEEDVVGYITNRGDGTELAVAQEMQGQGIGGELQYMFRQENPNAATGGLTEAGERSLQRTYNRLSEEGIAKDAQPTLKVDNPNEDWLASKIRFAERSKVDAPPNTYRANLGNSDGVTGYFSKPIEVDPRMLASVRGSMGEESFRPDARKIKDLRESIAEGGYEASPILIHVREDGVPFVVEGNHRIIEGVESGRQTIPVELKYLRGSEDVDGLLSPSKLGVNR